MPLDRDYVKNRVFNLAFQEGVKWGVIGTAAGAAGTAWGIYNSPWFVKSFSTSAKTSIPVMLGCFSWSLSYELTMNSAHRYPERWGLLDAKEEAAFKEEQLKGNTLPLHHKLANVFYDNTFEIIGVAGIALASKILTDNLKVPDLTLSQRIMHSRVFAQAGVLSILIPAMAFRGYMDKRGGRFLA